ncbi:hypothetical protein CsatB_024097 [Cannabis sativa]
MSLLNSFAKNIDSYTDKVATEVENTSQMVALDDDEDDVDGPIFPLKRPPENVDRVKKRAKVEAVNDLATLRRVERERAKNEKVEMEKA